MTKLTNPVGTRKIIFILAGIAGIGPFAIDTYLPALPSMALSFDASDAAIQQTLSIYLLGVAFAPLFTAPLSDAWGRKPILITGLSIFLLASLACSFAPNVETLTGLRLAQAVGGGTTMIVARAILADLYRGDALSRAMSQLLLVFSIAPMVAPLFGSALLELGSWRYIFGFLALLAAVGLLVQQGLPETLGPEKRASLNPTRVAGSYWSVVRNRAGLKYLIYTFMSGAFFFAMLGSVPFIFVELYGMSEAQFALIFAAISAAALPSNALNTIFVMRVGYNAMLYYTALVLLGMAVILLIMTALGIGGWIGFFVPLLAVMGAFHLTLSNTIAGLMDVMKDNAGAGSAVISVFRFTGGAVGAALTGAFGEVSQMSFTLVLLSAAIAMVALSWPRPAERRASTP